MLFNIVMYVGRPESYWTSIQHVNGNSDSSLVAKALTDVFFGFGGEMLKDEYLSCCLNFIF